MKYRQQAAPEFTTDADGQQLAHVALANTDQRATLYAEDYQRWLAAGFSPYWSLCDVGYGTRYVLSSARTAGNKHRSLTVARWVADAGKGQRVRYADGDRLNLRRENLVFEQGPAGSAVAWLRPCKGIAGAESCPQDRDRPAHIRSAPTRPTETQREPTAPPEPRQPFTPRVVDVAALGQRVRQQMTAQAVEVTA